MPALPSVRDGEHVELQMDPCKEEMMCWGAAECCARRMLPELLSCGKGAGDSKAALHLYCRNFHRCSPNQMLLLAGTGLRGRAQSGLIRQIVLPQFPCLAEPAAQCVWFPGREAALQQHMCCCSLVQRVNTLGLPHVCWAQARGQVVVA